MIQKSHIIIKILGLSVLTGAFLAGSVFVYFSPYTDRVIALNGYYIAVQDRTTPQQWQKGLSDRASLCQRCGMLFLFPDKKQHGFWMKDMKFDIDILWLDEGRVVHIEHNVNHQTPEVVYKPAVDVNAVLELPAGKAQELDIDLTTTISI